MVQINARQLFRRPLSLIASILAVTLIFYESIDIARGNLYQRSLNFMDGTTLVELGILMLWGVYTLRDRTDLQAVSFTLVAGLSFIFAYEAVYKWSFYLTPFQSPMPPQEMREFVIQVGIAAAILTGFADGLFTIKPWTLVWLAIFVVLWIFWLLTGFPQITEETIFPALMPVNFSHDMLYLLNRGTKAVMYFAYLSLFPPLSKT